MARTVKEIKDAMTATFCKERAVVDAYKLNPEKTFDQQFSSVSIENILFYCFAFAVWTLEVLFDKHKEEVEERIEQLETHTLRWYVNKAKAFMYGYKLVDNADYYDTSNMSETDIENARLVKYAVATEDNTVVYLKVAGRDENGNPAKLSTSVFSALTSYLNTIKDAGVAIKLVNEEADRIKLQLNVPVAPADCQKECFEHIGNPYTFEMKASELCNATVVYILENGRFVKSSPDVTIKAFESFIAYNTSIFNRAPKAIEIGEVLDINSLETSNTEILVYDETRFSVNGFSGRLIVTDISGKVVFNGNVYEGEIITVPDRGVYILNMNGKFFTKIRL